MALVPICKKKKKERKEKVLGQDTESELVGFLKFRISGIFKVALLSFRSSQVTYPGPLRPPAGVDPPGGTDAGSPAPLCGGDGRPAVHEAH